MLKMSKKKITTYQKSILFAEKNKFEHIIISVKKKKNLKTLLKLYIYGLQMLAYDRRITAFSDEIL